MMTKEQYLNICEKFYPAINELEGEKDFYLYEKKFIPIMQLLNRQVLEKSIGEVTADRRKKKLSVRFVK